MPQTRQAQPAAPMLTVHVLQKHIDNAHRETSNACMIAEAIKEAYPQYTAVSVDVQTIRLSDQSKGYRYIYLTPRPGQQALVAWDQGINVTPFSMRMRAAQIITMYKRANSQTIRRHKLGKTTIKDETRPDGTQPAAPIVIGGTPPKKPKITNFRKFGIKAYTPFDTIEQQTTPTTT